MTLADDVDKLPIQGGGVNKPVGGTQGAKAETQRLADALPDPTPPPGEAPPEVSPTGVTNVRSNRDAASLPGIPAPMMAPSNRPGVRVDTPLEAGPGAPTQTAAQKRLSQLDLLANSPDVNETTRQWAKLVIQQLTG